jgi:AcrR family transcriptional regulator
MARRKGPSLNAQDVVAAAIRVLEANGPDAFGISRVATELKIKPASMYNHVASADALANAVALDGNRQIYAFLKAEIEGMTDPREQLRSLAVSLRQWAPKNRGLYEHIARVEPNYADPDAAAILDGILSLFDQPLNVLGIADDQRVHAMRTIRSALHGFVILEASGQFQFQEAADDSFQWMVDGLILGLAVKAGKDTKDS